MLGDGYRKPLTDPGKMKDVRIARISYVGDGGAACSCGGWSYIHPRPKVLEDAIDRHLNKRHGGRGIRL